ncbi:RecQ family ATP-dependent DNA helicase [Alkalibacillus salilacus]|uniref:ATP-dependent DNA helicase RecQ n=1 Tax=Alkalibacillus salilacus TaxID=284582 RepID=A0ABT9VC28_9BACI|nr:ATP-dependent DNA helicase RecQ [Alkalibacillus salilacus]MDQ0158511.1 ATP-dependent DNA helicase RecQ [Alkalibacillus salilacus]
MVEHQLEHYLKKYFGFETFKVGQQSIIESVLAGHNTLATLPTGSGKSITYQLPALLSAGITIVVSPLLSLMIDQVKVLKAKGIKRVATLTSLHNSHQKQRILNHLSNVQLLYCSPEMLQQSHVMNYLKQQHVNYFVIDEAHCLSQWGHEFRTDYLKLNTVHRELGQPPLLALSATATDEVQQDIVNHFNLSFEKIIYPIDRPNITLSVRNVETVEEKHRQLTKLLEKKRMPTMIYFSSRMKSESVCYMLQQQFPDRSIAFYHGGMESEDRLLIQQQFMYDQLDVICCTSAFGMGVDKANIRLVIHYHMPSDLESYIQEIGRAGRDGRPSLACLLYQRGDESLPFHLIGQELPDDEMISAFLQAEDLSDKLTETQERFLAFQAEKNRYSSNDLFHIIQQVRDQRLAVKKDSIIGLLKWIHTDQCRRQVLYKKFQEEVKTPEYDCCDQCGFRVDDWELPNDVSFSLEVNWEKRLNELFNKR